MLMLSYGMNTSVSSMGKRCPAARSLGRYDLLDHKLVFRGVADAVYSEGDVLQCVLWDITEDCEQELDILEGYSYLYDKKEVMISFMGVTDYAMMYYMLDSSRPYRPSTAYLAILKEGYAEHGLNLQQLYQAEGFYDPTPGELYGTY